MSQLKEYFSWFLKYSNIRLSPMPTCILDLHVGKNMYVYLSYFYVLVVIKVGNYKTYTDIV